MSNMQTDINEKMRGILLDWLIDVHLKFKLLPETLFITVNVIDRYLSLVDIHRTKLQLVGVAALFIACKYEEVYSVPHIKDLVYVCDKAYTKEEILSMEGQIIEKLDFNLISVSPLRFLDYYTKQIKMDEKNYMLCRYLIEMTLIELKMAKYKPSMIACASIYLVHKIRKNSQPWNEAQMQKNTLYCEQEIRPCAKDLCTLLQTIDKRSTFKSLQRKFSLSQYCENPHNKYKNNSLL
ncbi:Cyclin-like protein [Pseudocohnilembus persalinus]|uniref:Cyclin-like protein n=1 Tax=Pseudocohnilembus persalinus TaxID=266149 RepID=A0A0V0Q7A3_PSEPJ|nr:Cyclin-like protein [Pseudocohnilembus persalinus]|eukprot:KRW98108.1 Cyclin-like protein [Pseudocohnilembus persalinus]